MDNKVINFMDQRQNAIEVKNEVNMPQEIGSDDEFPVNPRLVTETKTGQNVSISIFLKYLLNILNII